MFLIKKRRLAALLERYFMKLTKASIGDVLLKKPLVKIRQCLQENICVEISFKYFKETPTQTLSCEYCEIFKKSYFEEHLRTAASEVTL